MDNNYKEDDELVKIIEDNCRQRMFENLGIPSREEMKVMSEKLIDRKRAVGPNVFYWESVND